MLDDIKKTLWATADKLRTNMDAAEYKHLVLGLIFVKYISDTFTARTVELAARLRDPDDEYFYGDANDEDIAAELQDRDYYTTANVFWVPAGARWEALRAAAKQPDIGKRIDDVRISANVTGHFGHRDRRPRRVGLGPFRYRDRPFRRS